MRALCSVRGGEALGAAARLVALRVPGRRQPLHFVVEAKARARDLRTLAYAHTNIVDTSTYLFGLAVMNSGEYLFVDLDSKLSKYAPKSWRSSHTHGLDANGKPLLELHLTIQFHVESPLLLQDDISRHLYFLQLRHNVKSRDTLPAEVLLLLTGLALQAEYGDANSYEDRDYFNVEEYAPSSLNGDWVAAAMRACHREHCGLAKSDAEIRYIRETSLLPDTINSHRYRLKQSKTESEPGTVWLLITPKGIKVLSDTGHSSFFIWSSITKLSFDRKKFEIRSEDEKVILYSSTDDKCKYLFGLCKETHQFRMKIAPKLNEISWKEEEERKSCFGYSKSLYIHNNKSKSEQRISVISSTSSNTTSGIVSDRVQSEDELEIMIDSPPAPSTESLALAHLLDCSKTYFLRHVPQENQPLTKTSSLQLHKTKNKKRRDDKTIKIKEDSDNLTKADCPAAVHQSKQSDETASLPEVSIDNSSESPDSSKLKCAGSQCSSSCSTVIMARAGLSTLSRTSDASSLELGFSHTAQNSMLSDSSTPGINMEYTTDNASALYDGLGQAVTVAASSETSGVYTMASSAMTSRSKTDVPSEDGRTDYEESHYDSFKCSKENDMADFDSVSSIFESKLERTKRIDDELIMRLKSQCSLISTDCVDGATAFPLQENKKDDIFRQRRNSDVSSTSFHGDGSDPTDKKHNLLSASELSDLIVGRGVYPKRQSVSDTLDSVSDYVRLPLPFSGDSYLQGHEDTAPSDDHYPDDTFYDRPPTPPARIDSRKTLNLSLPNILDNAAPLKKKFPDKPPPPYEYNHKTFSSSYIPTTTAPPAYPATATRRPASKLDDKEVTARVVTSKPMITILKAEVGDVNASSERTFASPMVIEHRFQKSKQHLTSSRRADRSKLVHGISVHGMSPTRERIPVDSSVLVAMMKLPPPPPPRLARRPPPPPARRPPPPPPHNPLFHQQLYSDVDYVYYPLQDPAISQQNYLDHKFTESRSFSNLHKSGLQYRSTPFLSTTMSVSSMYGSIQNLSDSYIQIPGARASLYSLASPTSSISSRSMHLERSTQSRKFGSMIGFAKAKSDENILNGGDALPQARTRRMPPPPPPPYEHKKKLPSHLRNIQPDNNTSTVISDISNQCTVNKVKDANCALDIKTLREKSKNLDLPLIAALCNDRSLLKQTKAFGASKINRHTSSDCESDKKLFPKAVQNTTDEIDINSKQDFSVKQSTLTRKTLIRNPTDKLPALPGESHTPRAMSNTYVLHPVVVKSKKIQPNS